MSANSPGQRRLRFRELPSWVVAFMVLALQLAGSSGADRNAGHAAHTPLDHFGYTLLTISGLALGARRRFPITVLLVTAGCTLLYHLRGYAYGPFMVAFIAALVSAVGQGRRVAAWITGFGAVAGYLLLSWLLQSMTLPHGLVRPEPPTLVLVAGLAVWAFAVLSAGELVRLRAERAAEARRVRAEQERRMAGEERLRIARELHDVLAHNISMINVRAGVALHLMEEQPEQVAAALTAIKAASKEALTEMRSVISVLRQQGEQPPMAPTAGLDRLDALVGQARTAGLEVTVEREGASYDLPAGVDLAVFRIIQESLTNVARHAKPPASGRLTVRIRLSYEARSVAVRVEDDGVFTGFSGGGDGSGLPGMRERATALEGDFSAGPRPGGGFRVEARLPVPGEVS